MRKDFILKSTKEIKNNLADIMCNYFDLSKVELFCDSSLTNDISLNSFSLISIVTNKKDRFNIRIKDEELVSFFTFNYILAKEYN